MLELVNYNQALYMKSPKGTALLFCEFGQDDYLCLTDNAGLKIKHVASENISHGNGYTGRSLNEKPGLFLLNVSSDFYQGKTDIDNICLPPRGLGNTNYRKFLDYRRFLGRSFGINPANDSIATVAQEIRRQALPVFRDNPYVLTEGIVDWIKGNIEQIPFPNDIIRQTTETIKKLSGRRRIDPLAILSSNNIGLKGDELKQVAETISLPKSLKKADNRTIAIELMTEVAMVKPSSQIAWLWTDECSAGKVLEAKAGKCVGIANLAVALSRNLMIPSKTLGGYWTIGNLEGEHAWASSYFYPYGWVEFDPTAGQLADFDHNTHAYELSGELYMTGKKFPKISIIGAGQRASVDIISRVQKLLENDQTWIDWFLRRKSHLAEIALLQSVK